MQGIFRRTRWLLLLPLWAGAGLAPSEAAETAPLAIDPAQSIIEVAVKATMDPFTAQLGTFTAEIEVGPAERMVTAAQFSFAWSELHTGKEGRDREMQRWQDSEHFPRGHFTLTSITPEGSALFHVTGTLELHGARREITFPVSVTTDGPRYAFDGEVTLDTRDFGLPVIRKFAVLRVDPHVVVRFHLQGHLPASP